MGCNLSKSTIHAVWDTFDGSETAILVKRGCGPDDFGRAPLSPVVFVDETIDIRCKTNGFFKSQVQESYEHQIF